MYYEEMGKNNRVFSLLMEVTTITMMTMKVNLERKYQKPILFWLWFFTVFKKWFPDFLGREGFLGWLVESVGITVKKIKWIWVKSLSCLINNETKPKKLYCVWVASLMRWWMWSMHERWCDVIMMTVIFPHVNLR